MVHNTITMNPIQSYIKGLMYDYSLKLEGTLLQKNYSIAVKAKYCNKYHIARQVS